MTNRNITLDIAKGIGILLVVLGHGYSSENGLYYWISSFHMPLFFIVTGIVYGMRAHPSTLSAFPLRKKLYSLLMPYLIWSLITQSFLGALKIIGGNAPVQVLTSILKQILTGNAGFLWFLPTLFLAEFLFYLFSNDRARLVGALILGGVGLFCSPSPGADFDFRVFVAFFFICSGYFVHALFRKPMYNPLLALIGCISILLGVYNGEVIIPGGHLGNPLVFVITALTGTIFMLQLSMRINRHIPRFASALSWLGQNSIVILCVHNILTESIRLIDYKTFHILPNAGVAEGFIVTTLTMAVLIPTIGLLNRYLYWSFGKKTSKASSK